MRESLNRWISDADALRHLAYFRIIQSSLELTHIQTRAADYYTALVGELFEMMRSQTEERSDWARLGNTLAQFAHQQEDLFPANVGVSVPEAALFFIVHLLFWWLPGVGLLDQWNIDPQLPRDNESRACFDLLHRPATMSSQTGVALLGALRSGNGALIENTLSAATAAAAAALPISPEDWIAARLFEQLRQRFAATNLRAVLPNGQNEFWTPLISSLLDRTPPTWEFFPWQIEAIQRGVINRGESFALQMPTGAGKTTLCETLLYWHARTNANSAAVMLVPYRALC